MQAQFDNGLRIVGSGEPKYPPTPLDTTRIDNYLTWLVKTKRRRSSTIEQYLATLKAFITFTSTVRDRPRTWGEVTAFQVEDFITRPRRQDRPPSLATMEKDRAIINQFFTYLHGRGVIATSPMLNVPQFKADASTPRAIDPETW